MPKRKITIPKVDLSRYNGQTRLPTNIEQILVEAVVVFKGNCLQASKYFNVDIEVVNQVAIKYYTQIVQISQARDHSENTSSALGSGSEIIKKHVAELKERQKQANSKILNTDDVKNLSRLLDRAISIQDQSTKVISDQMNKLTDNLVKLKSVETKESGEITDPSEYNENQRSVFDLLAEQTAIATLGKKVSVVNLETNEIINFNSLKEISEYFGGLNISTISMKVRTGKRYKEKYVFIETDKLSEMQKNTQVQQ